MKVISTYNICKAVVRRELILTKDYRLKETGIRIHEYLSEVSDSNYVLEPVGYIADNNKTHRLFDIVRPLKHTAKKGFGSYFECHYLGYCSDLEKREPGRIVTGGERNYGF